MADTPRGSNAKRQVHRPAVWRYCCLASPPLGVSAPGVVNNLSANTLQLIINQLFGLVIFYILSTGLDKNSFGQINLALALML